MIYVKVGGNMCCMGGGKPSSGQRAAALLHSLARLTPHRFHISLSLKKPLYNILK